MPVDDWSLAEARSSAIARYLYFVLNTGSFAIPCLVIVCVLTRTSLPIGMDMGWYPFFLRRGGDDHEPTDDAHRCCLHTIAVITSLLINAYKLIDIV